MRLRIVLCIVVGCGFDGWLWLVLVLLFDFISKGVSLVSLNTNLQIYASQFGSEYLNELNPCFTERV